MAFPGVLEESGKGFMESLNTGPTPQWQAIRQNNQNGDCSYAEILQKREKKKYRKYDEEVIFAYSRNVIEYHACIL